MVKSSVPMQTIDTPEISDSEDFPDHPFVLAPIPEIPTSYNGIPLYESQSEDEDPGSITIQPSIQRRDPGSSVAAPIDLTLDPPSTVSNPVPLLRRPPLIYLQYSYLGCGPPNRALV